MRMRIEQFRKIIHDSQNTLRVCSHCSVENILVTTLDYESWNTSTSDCKQILHEKTSKKYAEAYINSDLRILDKFPAKFLVIDGFFKNAFTIKRAQVEFVL